MQVLEFVVEVGCLRAVKCFVCGCRQPVEVVVDQESDEKETKDGQEAPQWNQEASMRRRVRQV